MMVLLNTFNCSKNNINSIKNNIMVELKNIRKYQLDAKRTCPTLGDKKLDLAHMVLGIFSEYEEYIQAKANHDIINQSEELSDMLWYIANYCTFNNYDFSTAWRIREGNGRNFLVNVSVLQDYVKKYIAYNKPIDTRKEMDVLCAIIFNIEQMFEAIDIEKSLSNNINKLKIRYPEKFDETLAQNRDLQSERTQLEK